MLTCHPHISIPPEGGWLIQLYPEYHDVSIDSKNLGKLVNALLQTPKIESWKLDYADLMLDLENDTPTNYKSFANRIYLHYAHLTGKIKWGDKNNFYLHHIDTIGRLFSEAVFIHIVRDGRDVACSYRDLREVKGEYAPSLPSSAIISAYDWTKNIRKIHKGFREVGLQRTFTLRYEDLVQEPEKTLRDVCAFLGEDYNPGMLQYAEENREKKLEPDAFMTWKGLTQASVTSSRIGRWKQEMFDEDRLAFSLLSNILLRKYCYETEPIVINIASLVYYLFVFAGIFQYRMARLAKKLLLKLRKSGS